MLSYRMWSVYMDDGCCFEYDMQASTSKIEVFLRFHIRAVEFSKNKYDKTC
jgi:hypothetical protein